MMQIRKAIGSRQSLSGIGGFKRLSQAWGKGDADRSKSNQVFCKVKSNRLWRPPSPSSLCHIPKYTLIDTTFNCPTLQGSFSNTNTTIKYLIVWIERQVGNIIMVQLFSGSAQDKPLILWASITSSAQRWWQCYLFYRVLVNNKTFKKMASI